jgi:NAD(P)-dependent dehydrogenase (short-subunit alcohol dehydrogenase family)
MAPLASRGAEVMVASVADPGDRDRIADAAGDFDYLVNSAGVLFVKSIWDVGLDEWRNLYAVNVEGTFFMCQRLGRQMRRGGAIMNLSSSSAKLSTTVEVTPYSSSKATILGITRSFAYVLAKDGIRVNAICPGIVDTPMQDEVLEAIGPMRGTTAEALNEARMKLVPLGRAASPAECAGAIWWHLSDEAGYMTGQAINYTGGLVMW